MAVTRLLAAAAVLAMLAGCVSRPEPAPAPQPVRPVPPPPAPPPPPPPPAQQDWADLPLSPGAWVYSLEGNASQAVFGNAEGARFIVRCDAERRQIGLSREGSDAGGALTIRTSTGARTLSATGRREPRPHLGAALPASDRFLDAMVFSRGRFAVEAAGLPVLVVPAWPEPARVIEDCRE